MRIKNTKIILIKYVKLFQDQDAITIDPSNLNNRRST
jgi:hypothetical protein